jgi:hypothetical protein
MFATTLDSLPVLPWWHVLYSDIFTFQRLMSEAGVLYNLKPLFFPNQCPFSLTSVQLDACSPERRLTHPTDNFPRLHLIL